MRFALRLILAKWHELATAGVIARLSYQTAAVRAVDANAEGIKDIRYLTACALYEVLDNADWGLKSTIPWHRRTPSEDLPTNKTLYEIQGGIKAVLGQLEIALARGGTEDLEYSDDELSSSDVSRASKNRKLPKRRKQVPRETQSSTGLRLRKPLKFTNSLVHTFYWTNEEVMLLLQIEGEPQFDSDIKRAVELKRRMDQARGDTLSRQRSHHAIQQQRNKMKRTGYI